MSTFAETETKPELEDAPPPKKSWVPTCLIGCGVIILVMCLACAGGFYWAYSQGPIWMMDTIVAGLDDSDLPEEEKREIKKQIGRVKTAYSDGDIGWQDFGRMAQAFVDSPFMAMVLIFAMEEQHLKPSGLSDEEKTDARRIIARTFRGIVEEKFDQTDLEAALDVISRPPPAPNQPRELKPRLDDEELREFIAECKKVVDEHEIPDEDYEVQVSSQLKKIVDELLGEGA